MKCLICGSTNVVDVGVVETIKRFEVVRCKQCQFVFTVPRPTLDELVAHYGADYFTNSNKEAGYNDYYTIGEMYMRAMWPSFKEYSGIVGGGQQSILDVGCASGAFLHEAQKDGWSTKGIELSEDAVLRAKTVYALDVEQGDIFSEDLKLSSFNIITLWHVLEHTLEPRDVLQRAHALLAPNGLVFIELPNWNSLGRILKGMQWKQLVPPAHINFFIKKCMVRTLNQLGFKVVKCSTHNVAGFDRLKSRAPKIAIPTIEGIETIVGNLGFGGYLRALAQKNDV